jgi:ribosomal protein S14
MKSELKDPANVLEEEGVPEMIDGESEEEEEEEEEEEDEDEEEEPEKEAREEEKDEKQGCGRGSRIFHSLELSRCRWREHGEMGG